jgi:hypothetical protein
MHHVMLECPVTRHVWHETLAWLRMAVVQPDSEATLTDWWRQAKGNTPKSLCKALVSTTLLIPSMAWKHRNDCGRPSVTTLIANIKEEIRMWARAGALGLRVVLP